MNFKTIGLIGKYDDPSVGEAVTRLTAHIQSHGLQVLIDAGTAETAPDATWEVVSRDAIGERCDLAVVVGGDGTLLNAARSLSSYDVPLVGINLGHLGFLTDISPEYMTDGMDQILRGDYSMEERFLLHCSILREGEVVSESEAFNDVVVHKWNVARMIELEAHINGQLVNQLRSDGLIVSTPTGSTAYALSAGGPILHPTLNAIVVVPVCPHTMSNRPIVIDGDKEIEIVVCNQKRDHAQATCDGQITFALTAGDRIRVRKKERPVRLVHLADYDHYQLLRAKLGWAETPKNP